MSYKCAQALGLNINDTRIRATGVDGKIIDIKGEVGPLSFTINQPCKKEFNEKFIVIDKMAVPINLSCNFMMKYAIETKHSIHGNVI